tara:strand:+ start:3190 stop:3543 length:354 start_codon:yes stop_codon:yes gene_type:complete
MINFFKKIGAIFSKDISPSKLKVFIVLPLYMALILSYSIKLDYDFDEFINFSLDKDTQLFYEFIVLNIVILILIGIDMIYELLNKKYNERKEIRKKLIIENTEISDYIKEIYLKSED